MAARGLNIDDAADFFSPTLRSLLPDPSVLTDMDQAAARLADAVRHAETIGVFGDYDVDGACSSALMLSFLCKLGCTVLSHVPDRLTEGYGPNAPALLSLAERGCSLVICVDCGTAAATALAALRNRADVIVLDHHKSEGPPPAILATVNPNRLDDTSGLRDLCATGVAFLTCVATLRVLRRTGFFNGPEPDLLSLLDLVALATVCDVMNLTGLNRAFVVQGLKVMAKNRRTGIAALLDVARSTENPTSSTLGFALGPRINAAGRLSDSSLGLRLLLCEDPVEASRLATQLDEVNRRRQGVEAAMLEQALTEANAQADAGRAVLLLSGTQWHPGVVGIVAGRIKERFNRPACVAALADGQARGSGRSVSGHDLGAAVIAARQCGILDTGGGHAMAAGFGLAHTRLDNFHDFLNERLSTAAALPRTADLTVEGAVSVPGATTELAQTVARLAPFGQGNAEPTFVIPHARVVRAERIGREADTIRLMLQGEGGGPRLKALLFRAGDGPLAQALSDRNAGPMHITGHLRAETWNGSVTAALFVSDAAQPS